MKRFYLFFILAILCITNIWGQTSLRENVVVVKPTYTASTVKFLTDFSNVLRRAGYNESAELLKAYTEGGFGSGFVYTDSTTQKSYVVTNRHVVAQANFATIVFSLAGKPEITYKYCPIIAADDTYDLGLIELPANYNMGKGFAIDPNLPDEGREVYTAGFPGLGSTPSWQLGHGIISNSFVQNKELSLAEEDGAIQHTAQIDAGSSGGPLLLKKGDTYSIIGINTWKSAGRESANFAISAKSVESFINNHVNINRLDEESLAKRIEEFANSATLNYRKLYPYISSEYVSNVSVSGFFDLLSAISTEAELDVRACFKNGRPIDGVRIALADAICNKYDKQELSINSIGQVLDKNAAVDLNYGDKVIATDWEQEQGYWRLKKFADLKLYNLDNNGIAKNFGYLNSAKLGMVMTSDNFENTQYTLSFERTYYTFVTWGMTLGSGNVNFKTVDWDHTTNPSKPQSIDVINKKGYVFLDFNLGGQVPFKVQSMYIIPNIKGSFGLNLGEELSSWTYGIAPGVDVAYKLNGSKYLLGGLSYKTKFYADKAIRDKPFSGLGVHIGIAW